MVRKAIKKIDVVSEPNVRSRSLFIERDNLDVLRGINSGCVDLIYLDPPFNSKREYAAPIGDGKGGQVMASFKDTWTMDDVKAEWTGLIADRFPALAQVVFAAGGSAGKGMQAYITMMAVRLLEMRRVLKPTGSIYLHCDSTAGHYLKIVMDSIFGAANFRNEINWRRTTAHSDSKRYGANTDVLLFYTKGGKWTWNRQYQPYDDAYKARFRFTDADGRAWSDDNLTAKGLSGGGYEYDYKGASSLWRVPLETMQRLDSEGRLHFTNRGGIRLKRYLDEMKGRPVQALWDDIDSINSQAKERLGYPTQKPLALLERIIKASSNTGDLVLDPFCGCATACVAAEKLNRHWIGIDLSPLAESLIHQRFFAYGVFGKAYRPSQPRFPGLTRGDIITRRDIPIRTADLTPLSQDIKHDLYGRQEGICLGCDFHFPFHALTLDHIVPRSRGGPDAPENLQLLCASCNSKKGNRLTLPELRARNRREGILRG